MSRTICVIVLAVICLHAWDILEIVSVIGARGGGGGRGGGSRGGSGGNRTYGTSRPGQNRSGGFSQLGRFGSSVMPGCELEPACGPPNINIQAELHGADPYNLTDDQFKRLCLVQYNMSKCYMDHIGGCIPPEGKPFLPLLEVGRSLLKAQFDVYDQCQSPKMHTDYAAIKPCIKAVEKHFSHPDSADTLQKLTMCTMPFFSKGQSAVAEYTRIVEHGVTESLVINQTALIHGLCCGGKAVTDCAVQVVRGICQPESVAVLQTQLDMISNVLNCTQVTSTWPCPA